MFSAHLGIQKSWFNFPPLPTLSALNNLFISLLNSCKTS